jgi:hypothetical protein
LRDSTETYGEQIDYIQHLCCTNGLELFKHDSRIEVPGDLFERFLDASDVAPAVVTEV